MNTLVNLLKDHQIGTWCKRAAWIVLIIGLVETVLSIYNATRQFGFTGQPFNWSALLQFLQFGLSYLPSTLFYFFILYAAGALVNYVVGTEVVDDEVDEDEDIVLHQ